MTWIAWLQLAGVCLLGAMAPGPSLAMIVQQTIGGGRTQGLIAALGHSFGVGLYAFATAQGLALVLIQEPWLFHIVSWVGAAYLFWLGILSLKASKAMPVLGMDQNTPSSSPSLYQAARSGLMVSLSNPNLVVFFIALLSQFVTQHMTVFHKVILVSTAVLLDVGWYAFLALFLSYPRVLEILKSRINWVNRACGIILMLLSCRTFFG